jgi:predicted DNA-binding protein (MmcQ/YjbR family)
LDRDTLACYLAGKPESELDFPFGPDAAVYKVKDKILAIAGSFRGKSSVNLKCDPDQASALRDIFEGVIPGYHMNKKHWNTVLLDGSVPDGEIERMIDHSYGLVVKSLSKTQRKALELQYGKEALYR